MEGALLVGSCVATRYPLVRLVFREREQTYIGATPSVALGTVPLANGMRGWVALGLAAARWALHPRRRVENN